MQENIRSELFFLKQFGFNDILLQHIFLSGLDPIQVIFKKDIDLEINLEDLFSEKEK
ncbi:DNA processing protein DprA, partial [Enterococcus faecalis]|nr:DNA processing protein DprA [Enterococcus faecalis]